MANGNAPGQVTRSSVAKSALTAFLPLYAVAAVAGVIAFTAGERAQRSVLNERLRQSTDLEKTSIVGDRASIISDLVFLSGQPDLERLFREDGSPDRQFGARLASTFERFGAARGWYDQIRVLDRNGKEIIRVNFGGGRAVVVPESELQDKKHRPYFKQAVRLAPGEVYVSPFDLNIEHGTVEQPFKPVIRFATPIPDANGRTQGILVLNYLGDRLLHKFVEIGRVELTEGVQPRAMLLNAGGYWLRSPNPGDEWGFMLPDRRERTFDREFGEAWTRIRSRARGQFETPQGLFTFTTVLPLPKTSQSGPDFTSAAGSPMAFASKRSYVWKVVLHVPPDDLYSEYRKHLRWFFVFLVGLAVILGGTSWRLAWNAAVRRQSEFVRRESEQRYRSLVENVNVGVYRRSPGPDARFLQANPAMADMFGYASVDEIMAVPVAELFASAEDASQSHPFFEQASAAGAIRNVDMRLRRKDGSPFWASRTAIVKRDENGKIVWIDGVIEDISVRKLTETQLAHMATHDPLTQLPNRMLFEDRLSLALHNARRNRRVLAVMELDLDGFKAVNDERGHQAGDLLLQGVADRLRSVLRSGDTVARIGGDEFLILLPDLGHPEEATFVAEKGLETLRGPFDIEGTALTITASIGIALYPDDGEDANTLVHNADLAMYGAKQESPHSYKRFSVGMNTAASE